MLRSRREFLAAATALACAGLVPVSGKPPLARRIIGESDGGWVVEEGGRRRVVQSEVGVNAMVLVEPHEWAKLLHVTEDGLALFESGNERDPDCCWIAKADAFLV